MDQLLSANDSTLPPSFIDVPLLRNGVKGSAWGTLNIGQMLVEVQTRGTVYSGATFTGIRGRYSYMPVAAEQNRGNVVLQTIIPYTNPVAGWNQWNDVPWYGPISLSKLILQHPAITMVEVYIADRIVHQKTKAASLAALAYYSRYTAPENYAAFPIIFDQLGTPGDFLPLFVGTTRQTVKLRFFWDTTITATPVTFQTYIEGVEADYNQLTPGK